MNQSFGPNFQFSGALLLVLVVLLGFFSDEQKSHGFQKVIHLERLQPSELLPGRVDPWSWWITALDVPSCQRASRNTSIGGMGSQGDTVIP